MCAQSVTKALVFLLLIIVKKHPQSVVVLILTLDVKGALVLT